MDLVKVIVVKGSPFLNTCNESLQNISPSLESSIMFLSCGSAS